MKSVKFENVSFGYKRCSMIFNTLSCNFSNPSEEQGYVIALMGASGSGKTTFLNLLNGGLKPSTGYIDLKPKNPIVSYLPQETVLFDHLTPLENAKYFAYTSFYKKYFNQQLFEMLCGVLDMQYLLAHSKSVNELSGGQRQRLGLIRALSIKPDILLLDEPTTGLDSDVKLQFLHQFRHTVSMLNVLAIYVTHHQVESSIVADQVAYLYHSNANGISSLFQDSISAFMKAPPVLEAVKIFNYPQPNILQCSILEDKTLQLEAATNNNSFFIALQPDNICFTETTGYSFTVLSRNPVFTSIQTETGQHLTISTNQCPSSEDFKINFTGEVLTYSADKLFSGTLILNENKV